MKKRTLNKTWTLCLRMWRHISEVWIEGLCVEILKKEWLKDNGFGSKLHLDCFFCEYHDQHRKVACGNCPGKLVDSSFTCTKNNAYNYNEKPVKFYQELLRLNQIRKAKK